MKSYVRSVRNLDLSKCSEVEIYKMVLDGTLSRFPKGFCDCEEADSYAPSVIRYMIEEIEGWKSRDEVPLKIRKSIFIKNKLAGMLSIKYNSSPSKAVMMVYPERGYKAWEFHETQNSFWAGSEGIKNGIEATKWLFEEKLKWSEDEIKANASWEFFRAHGLIGMVKRAFNDSIWKCINTTYPGRFKRWEIGEHVANEYWSKQEGIEALKWLIEERLNWSRQDICEKFSKKVFIDNDLYGMLQRCFDSNLFNAINEAYPGEFKPWELNCVSQGFWNEENSARAVRWLLEEKLGWDEEQIKGKFSIKVLKNNGLVSVGDRYSAIDILNLAYPGKEYKPWELKASSLRGYWNYETIEKAIKWLVEEKLCITPEEAKSISRSTLVEYGLSGILKYSHKSARKLVIDIYDL